MKTKSLMRQKKLEQLSRVLAQRRSVAPQPDTSPPPEVGTGVAPAGGLKKSVARSRVNVPAAEVPDEDLALLFEVLKSKRMQRKLSQSRLAKLAGVPAKTIERLEACDAHSIRLRDLLSVAKVLDTRLTVQPVVHEVPTRPTLPQTNEEILTEFDRLLRKGKCNAFSRKQPDNEHPGIFWDVVGDVDRNWLFVVASNPRKKVRVAKVTDNPGGWAVGGQVWGIDAETQAIAGELSEQLFTEHQAELTD